MCYNLLQLEAFPFAIHEMILFAEEDFSFYSPMVIDEVGIIEIDAPPLALGWKTTEEKHACIRGTEWDEWVILYAVSTAGNVVEI